MSRKFYKTTLKVEVLSEEPVDFEDLAGVHYAITTGDCSGEWEVVSVEELNGKETTKALKEQGSDPGFFQLSDEGEEEDDE